MQLHKVKRINETGLGLRFRIFLLQILCTFLDASVKRKIKIWETSNICIAFYVPKPLNVSYCSFGSLGVYEIMLYLGFWHFCSHIFKVAFKFRHNVLGFFFLILYQNFNLKKNRFNQGMFIKTPGSYWILFEWIINEWMSECFSHSSSSFPIHNRNEG